MSGALFPVFTRGGFGNELALLVQLIIGMGFGFALERSGFARSENLVSIFYGRDFRVMRVMFTAILTAMAGLIVLSGVGLMDMGLLYINETFLWPQLVGGLLLGAGFVISGYCPGTSVVGIASGRIDALLVIAGVPLGRLSSQIARILQGKHKPTWAPYIDSGDFVVVVNAEKTVLTGKKDEQKVYYRHSGRPGALKEETAGQLRERFPVKLVERAVKGMLPKSKLGRQQYRKLKVYAGAEHPHQAQQPVPLSFT